MATYQVFGVQKINDTIAHWLAWAQTFGQALTTFGWVKQSGHGELVDNGSTGAAYAFANVGSVITLPTTVLQPVQNYRFNGAFVPSNTYTGSNTINSATTTDLVTFTTGGNTAITYVHITASSSLATTPPADTTNWQPFMYEIWKTGTSGLNSNPIYMRIVYTTSAASNGQPAIHLAIGTGVDSNGNLTGVMNTSNTAPKTNAIIYSSATGSATTTTLNFAGDVDNFRMVLWQGTSINAGANLWNLVIDRSKTATGGDSDAFVYVGTMYPTAGTALITQSIIPKPSLGVPIQQGTAGSNVGWTGFVSQGNLSNVSLIAFGATPPLPIFPLVGYVANPLLGAVGFNFADVSDGQIMPVWLYGSSHNYLVAKEDSTTAAYCLNDLASGAVLAIRWE